MHRQHRGGDALVVFTLWGQRYALHLTGVQRVIPAVEITPLPQAPDIILGAINVHGEVMPVVNVRKRFGLPEREIDPRDQLIIGRTLRRSVALVTDAVAGVIQVPDRGLVASDRILPNLSYVEGVMKLDDGIILIHDLGRFLSLDEEEAVGVALEARGTK